MLKNSSATHNKLSDLKKKRISTYDHGLYLNQNLWRVFFDLL
jgi:hypothetical protein